MANKKLRKPILLQEEFAASEISNQDTVTTPSTPTKMNSVGIDQTTVISKEQQRAEIVQDVDTILNNLEALSKRISEDIDTVINDMLNEEFNLELNENAGATLMAMFKAGAAAAKLNAKYPKLLKKKKQSELDKTIYGFQFDAEKEQKIEAAVDKMKDAINAKIDKLDDPAAKKKARNGRDQKLEDLKKQAGVKLDRKKTDNAKNLDRDITDWSTKISKLIADNKVGDSPMISAEWEKAKLSIERDLEDSFLAKERKVQDEFVEDPERLKKWEDAAEARVNKEAKEDALKAKKAEENAKEAATKLEEEIANASDSEKEALEKVKAYMNAISQFGAATGVSAADPENNELYKEAKAKLAELKDAYKAIGDKDYASAFGYEGDSKESDVGAAKLEFKDRIVTMEDPFDQIVNDGSDEEDAVAKSAEDVAKDALGEEFSDYTKIEDKDEKEPDTTNDAGETVPGKKKWMDVKTYKGKDASGEETEEEVMYAKPNDNQSAATVDGEDLEEGNEFGAARAEAIAKGEKTFKVGDEEYPVEDVSKDDKENAEEFVEEAKEELPKKVKLYEGMSVADRFKALM